MVADVYAGDTDSSAQAAGRDEARIHAFTIVADAEPQALLRIVMMLGLANTAPRRLAVVRTADHRLSVEAELDDLNETSAEYILRKLCQVTDVIAAERTALEDSPPAAA